MKPSRDVLQRLYQQDLLSTRQIADRLGVSHTTIKKWLRGYAIPCRPSKPSLEHRGSAAPSADDLRRLIHVEHLPYREIAERLNVSYGSVRLYVKRYGIKPATVWGTIRNGDAPALPDEKALRKLYVEDRLSQRAIAAQCGVTDGTIAALMRRYGVVAREGGFNGGQRFTCADGHEVRSTYERRVDDWLHTHDVSHTYEPALPFDRRMKADFLANGWYVEVWGVKGNARYRERRDRKRLLYAQDDLPLIQLSVDDFSARQLCWPERLRQCLTPPPSPLPEHR